MTFPSCPSRLFLAGLLAAGLAGQALVGSSAAVAVEHSAAGSRVGHQSAARVVTAFKAKDVSGDVRRIATAETLAQADLDSIDITSAKVTDRGTAARFTVTLNDIERRSDWHQLVTVSYESVNPGEEWSGGVNIQNERRKGRGDSEYYETNAAGESVDRSCEPLVPTLDDRKDRYILDVPYECLPTSVGTFTVKTFTLGQRDTGLRVFSKDTMKSTTPITFG